MAIQSKEHAELFERLKRERVLAKGLASLLGEPDSCVGDFPTRRIVSERMQTGPIRHHYKWEGRGFRITYFPFSETRPERHQALFRKMEGFEGLESIGKEFEKLAVYRLGIPGKRFRGTAEYFFDQTSFLTDIQVYFEPTPFQNVWNPHKEVFPKYGGVLNNISLNGQDPRPLYGRGIAVTREELLSEMSKIISLECPSMVWER